MKTSYAAEKTLTAIEWLGLNSKYDLANGHASHELLFSQQKIIEKLSDIWQQGLKQTSHEAEVIFKNAFQQLAKTPSLINYQYFKICPTASNSIDIAAAWLSAYHLKTALLEPTFDNLYLLLKRRDVSVMALEENLLHTGNYQLELKEIDALFLVNPNNPTGKIIPRELLKEIIYWCANNNKIIILDHSFRFFIPPLFDVYQILLDADVSFISIEDTGKVWPTQEIKASLLVCSPNIFKEIAIIYDELFLCHSNFSLGLLTEFLKNAHEVGLEETVWKLVAERRKKIRDLLPEEILSIPEESLTSKISVEWVKINSYFRDDFDFINYFSALNLVILPGRQFFWSHSHPNIHSHFIRFALLKPESEFLTANIFLENELKKLIA